eukprot:jgi/Mesen1/10617/ME000089S10076
MWLGRMVIHNHAQLALASLAVAAVSDWLDGYLARRLRVNSVIGSYLDPLADKWRGLGAILSIVPGEAQKMEPLFISKVVNTVLQLALVGAALLQPALGESLSPAVATGLANLIPSLTFVVAGSTVASWIAYGVKFGTKKRP